MRRLPPLVVPLVLLAAAAPADAAGPGETLLLSTASGAAAPLAVPLGGSYPDQGDGISASGRYVVFTSGADGMSALDDDRYANVFVRDATSGTLTLVSRTAGGQPARGNSGPGALSSSEASPKVAFISRARLTGSDFDDEEDVYVRDLLSGALELVSRRTGVNGQQPAEGEYNELAISGDGTVVAFTTDAALDPADANGAVDLYVRDLDADTTTRETVRDNGVAGEPTLDGAPPSISGPSLSQAGDWISYTTNADNVDAGVTDANDDADVVARNRATGANSIVSMADGTGATTAAGRSASSDITRTPTQTWVAYTSTAALAAGDADTAQDVYRRQVGTTVTTHISVNTDEADANAFAELPALGDDPDEILFSSSATNLGGAADTNGRTDVFLRDTVAGTTDLVSREGPLGPVGSGESRIQSLSANGSYAVFGTNAASLAPTATVFRGEVVRRKLTFVQGNTVTSASPTGATANPGGDAWLPRGGRTVSADGRYVVFTSAASGLSVDDAPGEGTDVFRRDVVTGATTLVSRASGAAGAGGDQPSDGASISSDGARVAFVSRATNLTGDAATGNSRVYVRDLAAATTVLASRATGGGAAAEFSDPAAISGDGRRVAFVSYADLTGEGELDADAFVRDLGTGATIPASVADGPAGALGTGATSEVAIDATGRRVAFVSEAPDLGDGDADGIADVHVRDLAAGTTVLASRAIAKADQASSTVSISGDGQRVAFISDAGNLASDQPAGVPDVYLRDLAAGTTVLVSRATGGAALDGYHQSARISLDGSSVAFETFAEAAIPGDAGPWPRTVVRRLATGELIPLARATGPSGVLASASSSTPDLDADGSCGVFATRSTNLVPAVVSADVQNVWMRVLGPGCPDPDPGAAPPPGAGPARDTTRPVLSRVSMRRARFRAGPRPTALVARKRAKRGSAFRFTSSEAGTLRIAVARKAAGRRAAGRCRKPTPKLRGRKRCTRLVAVGTLRRSVAAGRGTVAFSGRLRSGSLRAARYRASLTVTDAAGNRSAARRVAFRVVR